MHSKEQDQRLRLEPRWSVVFTILAVLFVLTLLPSLARLLPSWFPYVIGTALVLPMAGIRLSGGHARWLRIERMTIIAFSVLAEAVTLTTLFYLILEMMDRPDVGLAPAGHAAIGRPTQGVGRRTPAYSESIREG